ncbi:phd finger protein male sterility 1 [Quercus suber]|uniref:Phd finger protein male sterility 1 n=1 Tax=Quercus suber TaxID=58331 RepID=A0AAW0M4P9_QUESU
MSHLDLIGHKKRKRGLRVFRFKSFGEPGYPIEFVAPFRENVKALLEFGHLESNSYCEMPSWSFQLELHRHPPFHILLLIIEEPDTVTAFLNCEGNSYNGAGTANGKSNLMELQGHIMHGVFHSNGFGHLLCVNGVEMGSDLAGHQIMEFWDRLCTGLRARFK